MNITSSMLGELRETIVAQYVKDKFIQVKGFCEYFNITTEDIIKDLTPKVEKVVYTYLEVFPNVSLAVRPIEVYVNGEQLCTFDASTIEVGRYENHIFGRIYLENVYPEQAKEYKKYVAETKSLNEAQDILVKSLRDNINSAVACCATVKEFKTHFKKYGEVLNNLQKEYKKLTGDEEE